MTRPISDLDVPTSQLQADMRALVARQRTAQLFLDARAHTSAESERIAYALDARLILHPKSAPADVVKEQRRAALLRAMQAQGGRWKAGRVISLYRSLGYGAVGKSRAAHDLRYWAQAGLLDRHDHKGVTYYTPRQQGGAR